jgi:hypothetical protein
MEETHTVRQTKRKMSNIKESSQNPEVLEDDLVEMEFDNDNQVLEWVVVQLLRDQQFFRSNP